MLHNSILFLIALLSLFFIWMFWVRHILHTFERSYLNKRDILLHDFEKRRDKVPYLLESYRKIAQSDLWRKIAEERAWFHTNSSWQKELEFEDTIYKFIGESSSLKSLHYLAAKKEILQISEAIENEKKLMKEIADTFNQKIKVFPYSFASAIFGFREIQI